MIVLNTERNTNFVNHILESRSLGIEGLATCEKYLNVISNFGFREISAFQSFLVSQLVAFLRIEGIFQMHSPVKVVAIMSLEKTESFKPRYRENFERYGKMKATSTKGRDVNSSVSCIKPY